MRKLLLIACIALTTCTPTGVQPTQSVGRIYRVIGDVNGDGSYDCIDLALVFYRMCIEFGYDARLIYGERPENHSISHLWVRVNGVDIEPFTYLPDNWTYRQEDVSGHYHAIRGNYFDWTKVHQ